MLFMEGKVDTESYIDCLASIQLLKKMENS